MDDVENFIEQLTEVWQKQKCHELLTLQREASINIYASIKWGNPYFTYNGKALLKWYCANGWINVYFFRGVDLNDHSGLFVNTDNKKMRTIKVFADTKINRVSYIDLCQQALTLNS